MDSCSRNSARFSQEFPVNPAIMSNFLKTGEGDDSKESSHIGRLWRASSMTVKRTSEKQGNNISQNSAGNARREDNLKRADSSLIRMTLESCRVCAKTCLENKSNLSHYLTSKEEDLEEFYQPISSTLPPFHSISD